MIAPLRFVCSCALIVWWWRYAGALERRLLATQFGVAIALGFLIGLSLA